MSQQQTLEIYQQVIAHYEDCYFDASNLSDTWTHTLDQKGRVYSVDDMLRMRAPGSKVTAWTYDSTYLVDSSIIDLRNEITAKLLGFGESDFGFPSKDTLVEGGTYTGQFLKFVGITSQVIQVLETTGNHKHRVLEIGGGIGIIPYLLRRYYGDSLTVFAIDIPETLMIQEWYLRNVLPNVPSTYLSVPGQVQPIDGGLNFMNAHVYQEQDVPFDFAININSMQEMSGDTAQDYIRYIERNIAADGMFFFQNHHGHSATSVPEPSEYEMDNNWNVVSAQLTEQIGNCSESEMARWVFRRTQVEEPADARRLSLRLVWNGLLSGLLQNGAVIQDLVRPAEAGSLSEKIVDLGRVLEQHKVSVDPSAIAQLKHGFYFPEATYVGSNSGEITFSGQDDNSDRMAAVRRAQSRLTGLMYSLAGNPNSAADDAVREQVSNICAELLETAAPPIHLEYWNAYFCGLLLPLGRGAQASKMLVECGARSDQTAWLIRFAQLLSNYGFTNETTALLEKIQENTAFNDDVYLRMEYAKLKHICGQTEDAQQQVEQLVATCANDLAAITLLGKLAAEIAATDVVKEVCATLDRQSATASLSALLDVAAALANHGPSEDVLKLVQPITKSPDIVKESPGLAARYGVLMSRLGLGETGLPLIHQAMDSFQGSYFDLGWLGKTLQEAGLNGLADTCVDDSLALRPGNFMHHDFVGEIYLSAERIDEASKHFDTAVSIKPNLRHLRGKSAYCKLNGPLRDSRVFGGPRELAMIFQRRQDFYQIGPAWK